MDGLDFFVGGCPLIFNSRVCPSKIRVCVFVCVLAQALVHSGLEENQSKTSFEFSSKIRLHVPF